MNAHLAGAAEKEIIIPFVIFTLLAKIFTNIMGDTPGSAPWPFYEGTKNLIILLFLFVDVDLILVLLASYLRIFKSLKRRLV